MAESNKNDLMELDGLPIKVVRKVFKNQETGEMINYFVFRITIDDQDFDLSVNSQDKKLLQYLLKSEYGIVV